MATQRVLTDTPPPVHTDICSPFQAALGANVTFNGVDGIQSITPISGETWPFNPSFASSGFSLPRPVTPSDIYIRNDGALQVGSTYHYNVSQVCTTAMQKGVTIVDQMPEGHHHEEHHN